MYHRILIPVDLSQRNEVAVHTVRELADPQAASITLLHVIETLQDVPFEEMEDFYQELRDKAEHALAPWMEALSNDGFEVGSEVVYGKRGHEIVRSAVERDVDLIVLRSHAWDRDHPTGRFGTLSHEVTLLAPCSVLLVRREK